MSHPAANRLLLFARRHVFCSACAGASLLLAGAAWLLARQLSDLEAAQRARAQEGAAMLAALVAGPELRRELAYARTATRRLEENLVVETNLAENLWYFYKLEERTKARLSGLRQLNAPVPDTKAAYRLIPYSLRLTGTYEQVAAFLRLLETGPRLIVVRSFGFRRSEAGAATVALELEIELLGQK